MVPTAMLGLDYVAVASTLTFTSGFTDNDVTCAVVGIIDDSALERNQTFTVTLTTPDPDVMLGTDMTTVTITDNDG